MARLKIYTFPDKVLAQKAVPIGRVEKSLFPLADDMLETMYFAPGVGLAANQVGILQRIIVVDTDYDLEELPEEDSQAEGSLVEGAEVVGSSLIKNKNPRIFVNPEITYREGSICFSEGCLSVPEYSAEVKRSEKIKLNYLGMDGVQHTLSVEGFLAVAIQHEIDHLDGRLFIDRLSPLKKEMVKKKLRQERQRQESEELSDLAAQSSKKKRKEI